ncbi:MAG TPA: prolyl oligopeptidase family serine peptidase [Gemmataceae bacterium]|nr:prolyl oligopeptidase family serine peptidase [Gemmataceae bacterium]
MNRLALALLLLLLAAGCNRRPVTTPSPRATPREIFSTKPEPPIEPQVTLVEARRGFKTRLLRKDRDGTAPDPPPAALFRLVRYESPAGKLAAYLSPDPGDGKKHPAIIWIFGGFSNGIGSTAWEKPDPKNDQSASAFRKAGIVMMYPSFRGGNDNPGVKEGFFGEVDDVLAARDFLAEQPFVDPERIYLGGHSTGGTLALLAAECSDRFRAVFSFGPVDDVTGYGAKTLPFDVHNPQEVKLRAPERWLHAVHCPTFVFEGTNRPGNIEALALMSQASNNPDLHFLPIEGGNHFSILGPTTALVAAKIRRDINKACNIRFSTEELSKPFEKPKG